MQILKVFRGRTLYRDREIKLEVTYTSKQEQFDPFGKHSHSLEIKGKVCFQTWQRHLL